MNKLGHIRLNLLKQKWLKIVFNFWLMMMIFVFYDKNTLLVVYTHTLLIFVNNYNIFKM